jgi:hypothetical protein
MVDAVRMLSDRALNHNLSRARTQIQHRCFASLSFGLSLEAELGLERD